MAHFALAADLGGTKIAVARVEETGRITHRAVRLTPAAGGAAVFEALAGLLAQLPLEGASALGVDVPGLAYSDGSVWAPNIPGWRHMPLGEMLGGRFRLPVLVESDRNAFVTGESWKGVARGRRDVVFVAVGTGIGAGIISGGRLIRGHAELAGCLGWMAVRERYRAEYEPVGCLEFHAAGPGIAREVRRVFGRSTSTRDCVRMARAGNKRAIKILAQAASLLGLALANLVDTLNPEMIVIGGGMAGAGSLLISPARKTMLRWAQPLAGKQVEIRLSRLGGRAGLLGAAKLAFDRFQ